MYATCLSHVMEAYATSYKPTGLLLTASMTALPSKARTAWLSADVPRHGQVCPGTPLRDCWPGQGHTSLTSPGPGACKLEVDAAKQQRRLHKRELARRSFLLAQEWLMEDSQDGKPSQECHYPLNTAITLISVDPVAVVPQLLSGMNALALSTRLPSIQTAHSSMRCTPHAAHGLAKPLLDTVIL